MTSTHARLISPPARSAAAGQNRFSQVPVPDPVHLCTQVHASSPRGERRARVHVYAHEGPSTARQWGRRKKRPYARAKLILDRGGRLCYS